MKVVLFANTGWYLYNFRKNLALALRDSGYEVILVSPEDRYIEKLQNLGFRWCRIRMSRRSLNPLIELFVVAQLVFLLLREKPTIIHSFTIKCAVYGAIAARISAVPFRISAVAGMGYVFSSQDFFARALRPFVRRLFRFSFSGVKSRLILQNADDAKFFSDLCKDLSVNISLIRGSGVDCSRFYPDQLRVGEAVIRVLLPARLLKEKGIYDYVEAVRTLHEKQIKAEFLLAGDPDHGNPSSISVEQVRAWEEEGCLRWLGHVDDMPELFRSVDIVTLPSYGEGLPKGLIEAAASGCALVATDVPGCREVIDNEMNGLLVPVRDSKALSEAIERLLLDSDLRIRLANSGRQKVISNFDDRFVINKTMEIYSEASNF